MQPNTLQSQVKVLVKAREKYFDIGKTKISGLFMTDDE